MLETLRKNATGWFSKILLGGIALIFALYFGFTGGGGPPQGGTAPIAKVNGQNIPSGLFNQTVSNQMSVYQQFGAANPGSDLQQVLQTQVLQSLIQETLLAQEAQKLGLYITDVEVANAIRNNPNFKRDGVFDENFYLKQFKPYYERQNGVNFEYALREDLLVERFQGVLNGAAILSENQISDAEKVKATQMKYRQLSIPFGDDQEVATAEEAETLAQAWIKARQAGESGETVLKDKELKVEELGPKALPAIIPTLGQAGPQAVQCLLAQGKAGVCEQSFKRDNRVIAVELMELTQVKAEEEASPMAQQLARAKENQILTGVTDLLTRQAKIETFLSQ